MPRFEPFPGVRYDNARVSLDDVAAPPYDVIDPQEREALGARSPWNVVHVDLAHPSDVGDRYQTARCRFDEWLLSGILATDAEPGFYVYKMGFRDDDGNQRQTSGVIGALGLMPPGEGGVLPHEHTMSRPKDDRLNLMRACRANLSPIWGLSLATGLSQLCEVTGPPLARCTDAEGVHHRLWRVTQPGVIEAITDTVASASVVIADGHHRYETALAWQAEVRAASADREGDHDLVLAYLVELAPEQLSVGPIHRAVSALPADFDPVAALNGQFDLTDGGAPDPGLAGRMTSAGALGLVAQGRVWLARPVPGDDRANTPEPDAALLQRVLVGWPTHTTEYLHRGGYVVTAVDSGRAQV
ncbi:MAG: DUF1015 domain-containing protein, partial [Actinomycetota bacterium]|nr:DUF1015 domain-containing protein [Actinomycetota bacterium]